MRVVILLLLIVSRASADEPSAASLLADASRLFTEEADLEGALRQFEAAYEREPSWRALNGIALVYQQQGRYVDALDTYERLMATFRSQLSDRQLETVNERLRRLASMVGSIQLQVAPVGATLLIDGRELACTSGTCATRVLPGLHTVVASLARYYTSTRKVGVAAGAVTRVNVALQPETERIRVVAKAAPTRRVRRFPRWSPWVTLGGGVLALGVAGALTGAAASDYSRFDAQVQQAAGAQPRPVTIDPSLEDRGRVFSDVSYALFAIGGVAIITGSALALVNRPELVIDSPGLELSRSQ